MEPPYGSDFKRCATNRDGLAAEVDCRPRGSENVQPLVYFGKGKRFSG
jgi:hypothetical protein